MAVDLVGDELAEADLRGLVGADLGLDPDVVGIADARDGLARLDGRALVDALRVVDRAGYRRDDVSLGGILLGVVERGLCLLELQLGVLHGLRIRRLGRRLVADGRRRRRRGCGRSRRRGSGHGCMVGRDGGIALHGADGAHLEELVHAVHAGLGARDALRGTAAARRARGRCRSGARHGDRHGLPLLDFIEVALRERDGLLEVRDLLVRHRALHVGDDIAGLDMLPFCDDLLGDHRIAVYLCRDERARDLRVVDVEVLVLMLVVVDATRTEHGNEDQADEAVFHQILYFLCDIDFQDSGPSIIYHLFISYRDINETSLAEREVSHDL